MDDRDLVECLVRGSSDHWRAFVERYQGVVYARVIKSAEQCNMHLDHMEAEDLCAEVFARLVANRFEMLRQFEGRSSLATWLAVVSHRFCLKYLHARRKTRGVPLALVGDRPLTAKRAEQDGLFELIRSEEESHLYSMLEQLCPRDQNILKLSYQEGLDYREISRQLGMPINSVGPTLHRARRRLRRLLEMKLQT